MADVPEQNPREVPPNPDTWFRFLQRLVRLVGDPDHNEEFDERRSNSVWMGGGREFGLAVTYRDPHYAFGARDPREFWVLYARRELVLRLVVTERSRWLKWDGGDLKDLPRRHGQEGRRFFHFLVQLGQPRRSRWKLTEREARACARHLANVFRA